jgi:hypothetical protein
MIVYLELDELDYLYSLVIHVILFLPLAMPKRRLCRGDNSLRVRDPLLGIQSLLDLLQSRVMIEPVMRVRVVGSQAGIGVVDVHAQGCAGHCLPR